MSNELLSSASVHEAEFASSQESANKRPLQDQYVPDFGKLAEHNEDEWTAFISHCYRSLLRVASEKGLPVYHAEDIVQDSLIIFYNRCDIIDVSKNPYGYLVTVIRRKVIDYHRYEAKHRRFELDERMDAADESPYDSTNEVEVRLDLEQMITPLKSDYQAVLREELKGHTNEETAQHLKIPLGTVKTRLMRAKRMMRESVQAQEA